MKNKDLDMKKILGADVSASLAADDIVTEEELRRLRKMKLIKLGTAAFLSALILIFMTIAWFSMNKETATSGMEVKVAGMPFELKTSSETQLYIDRLSEVLPDYQAANQTSGSAQAIQWLLTSESNIKNLRLDEKELSEITKLESSDNGLSPGDYGKIKFTVVPRDENTSLTLNFSTVLTAYIAEYDADGYEKTTEKLELVTNESVNSYLNGHILFFYETVENDVTSLHLIEQNSFQFTVKGETEITLYWVWPETLRNILNLSISGIHEYPSACQSVRTLLFEKPESFLERASTPEDVSKPFDEMSIDDATQSDIETVSAEILSKAKKYDIYSSWYNNADQTIGDEVSYITFELVADVQSQ